MRKSSSRAAVAGVLAAALLVAGCGGVKKHESGGGGTNKATGPIKLAVVPKAVGFSFWEDAHKGAVCAASKQKDVKVTWDGVTAETDVSGQVDLLQNFLTSGVDGLVYAATDAKTLYNVTKSAEDKKVPVVNIDSGTDPQPKDVPVYATDNIAAAQKVPDLIAKKLGNKGGKVAFIPFQAGTITNDQRTQGFKDGLKKHPELKLVATQSSQSDVNTALRVTHDIITAHPDLNAIFAANEPGVIGAAQAVKQAGKAGKITIIGWDAAPDEVKGVQTGEIDALVVQNPFRMGYDSVNGIVGKIRKGTQPRNEDTGVTFVTKQNMTSPDVKALLKPSCTNPPKLGS
ncbi:MAG: ABC transporter substrate-binding protein [Streptosporangiales bacterium]|nr:ABC transporter substrate-binding protein [Streptosporangiales bacterium]MBO0892334.1 ABC transporter substrate-binding protein [Acidothermales bacterium]